MGEGIQMHSLLDDRDEGGHICSKLLVGVVPLHVAARERYSGAWSPVWLHLRRSRCEGVVHPGCPAFPKATTREEGRQGQSLSSQPAGGAASLREPNVRAC